MGPSGLVISKLGIQATASDTDVKGLICLKVCQTLTQVQLIKCWLWYRYRCLRKALEGREQDGCYSTVCQWLLSYLPCLLVSAATPPALLSQPTIHPLPLPLPSSQSPHLRIASTLLSLPHSTSYPPAPSQPSILGGKPYIDVSSTTGKVFVVVDSLGGSGRRGSFKGKTDSNGSTERERKDWLITMEFQQALESSVEDDIYKVCLILYRRSKYWCPCSRYSCLFQDV